MKSGNHVDEFRERYLGELAPLLEAARPLDSLSPAQQRKVRRRIVRTLFGTRRVGWGGRLLPVLAAVLLLAIGGAAFATAQRLGILPRFGSAQGERSIVPAPGEGRKRKAARPASVAPTAVPAPAPVSTPAVPAPAAGQRLVVGPAATVQAGQASPPARQLAMATPKAPRSDGHPVARAVGARMERAVRPRVAVDPTVAPAPVYPAPKAMAYLAQPPPAAPAPAPVSTPALAVPVVWPEPAPSAAPSLPAPAVVAPAAPKPAPAVIPTVAPKPQQSDQALFGHALRKLRVDNDAAAALGSLREHAKAYPKSPFVGERAALEVEALLTLHRDREALGLLDGMALESLPRSGERLVVRGELRAAARRWPEAARDFEQALSRNSGAPAWHERALWGRAVSRLRMGDREGGMADIEAYVDSYPKGRFAAEAARFFPKQ